MLEYNTWETNSFCNINAKDLYKYSIFFRNYIQNVADDVLKNGIQLFPFNRQVNDTVLSELKVELKDALFNMILSYRFNGVGYIYVETAGAYDSLDTPINNELPTGFVYLDCNLVKDNRNEDFIWYTFKVKDNGIDSISNIKVHKSRLIIYENYNYILGRHIPCYTQSFLLNVYIFERIYKEIHRKIANHNFIFYKDQSLSEIQDAYNSVNAQFSSLTTNSATNGLQSGLSGLFARFVTSKTGEEAPPIVSSNKSDITREIEGLKAKLDNDGMFFTGSESSDMKVIKYDLTYLKDCLELVKAKIGADTKEPLTRSFNEQTKGLGNDGKGDRSNYYDFLKGVQESVEVSCNLKLNKYFGLDMRFNSLIILSEMEKIEHDVQLLELFSKYKSLASNIDIQNIDVLKDNLYYSELFLKEENNPKEDKINDNKSRNKRRS